MATQPISVFKPSYLFNPTELLTEKLTSYHNWKPNQRLNGSTQPTTEIMEIKLDYWHETHPAILRCYHSYWSLCQPVLRSQCRVWNWNVIFMSTGSLCQPVLQSLCKNKKDNVLIFMSTWYLCPSVLRSQCRGWN